MSPIRNTFQRVAGATIQGFKPYACPPSIKTVFSTPLAAASDSYQRPWRQFTDPPSQLPRLAPRPDGKGRSLPTPPGSPTRHRMRITASRDEGSRSRKTATGYSVTSVNRLSLAGVPRTFDPSASTKNAIREWKIRRAQKNKDSRAEGDIFDLLKSMSLDNKIPTNPVPAAPTPTTTLPAPVPVKAWAAPTLPAHPHNRERHHAKALYTPNSKLRASFKKRIATGSGDSTLGSLTHVPKPRPKAPLIRQDSTPQSPERRDPPSPDQGYSTLVQSLTHVNLGNPAVSNSTADAIAPDQESDDSDSSDNDEPPAPPKRSRAPSPELGPPAPLMRSRAPSPELGPPAHPIRSQAPSPELGPPVLDTDRDAKDSDRSGGSLAEECFVGGVNDCGADANAALDVQKATTSEGDASGWDSDSELEEVEIKPFSPAAAGNGKGKAVDPGERQQGAEERGPLDDAGEVERPEKCATPPIPAKGSPAIPPASCTAEAPAAIPSPLPQSYTTQSLPSPVLAQSLYPPFVIPTPFPTSFLVAAHYVPVGIYRESEDYWDNWDYMELDGDWEMTDVSGDASRTWRWTWDFCRVQQRYIYGLFGY